MVPIVIDCQRPCVWNLGSGTFFSLHMLLSSLGEPSEVRLWVESLGVLRRRHQGQLDKNSPIQARGERAGLPVWRSYPRCRCWSSHTAAHPIVPGTGPASAPADAETRLACAPECDPNNDRDDSFSATAKSAPNQSPIAL